MIRQLRTSAKLKKVLWIGLLIFIIPSFVALYGTTGVGGDMGMQGGPDEVATITYPSGKEGTLDTMEWAAANQRLKAKTYEYALGKNIPLEEQEVTKVLKNQQILEEALVTAVLRDIGEEKGLRTTSQEARVMVGQGMPEEQRAALSAEARRRKQTLDQYLDPYRRGLTLEKMAEAIAADARVTHYEAWLDYQYRNERLVADVAKVNVAEFMSSVTIEEEALTKFYEEKKEDFRIPDQYTYSYILVKKDDLAASATVTEEEVTSHYASNQEEYRLPRKADVRQIFIRMPSMQDVNTTSVETLTSAIAETRTKAEEIHERAAKGESFASLADQFSQETNFPPRADDSQTTAGDTITSAGGYIGLITEDTARGWYGDDWTTAVFNMEPNTLAPPIETQRGFYIVRLEKLIQGEIQPLDEVRPLVEEKIREEKSGPMFEEIGERLVDLSENYTGLQGLAEATSLTVQTTGKVDEDTNFIPGIGLLGILQDAVEDIQEGGRSEVLTDDNRHLVIELREEFPSHIPELDAVRAKVEAAYRNMRAIELAREKAEKILAAANDSDSLKAAAVEHGTTVTRTPAFTRQEVGNGIGPAQQFEQRTVDIKVGDVILTPLGPDKSPQGFAVWYLAELREPARADFTKDLSTIKLDLLNRKREILLREFVRDHVREIGGNLEVAPAYR